MHWYFNPMGPGWVQGLLLVIVIAVFLGGMVAAGIALARHQHTTVPPQHDAESPLDVLAGRYARGEIDEEEYRKRRDTLQKSK